MASAPDGSRARFGHQPADYLGNVLPDLLQSVGR